MTFSLILPTRNRVEMLTRLCESVEKTTTDKSNIEMFVAYDWDDTPTVNLPLSYHWLHLVGRERGNSISKDYQNWLYPMTSGKYIFVLNDDVEFKTLGWDENALCKLETYLADKPDGIVYGWTSDNETSHERFRKEPNPYSCFPILTRNAIETLGYVMTPFYGGWSADVYLYKVYNAVNRILDLSSILVYHHTHWLGLVPRDETSYSMERMSGNKDAFLDPNPDIMKLQRRIGLTVL